MTNPYDPSLINPDLQPVRVHRQVTFDLPTFDALKAWQRRLESCLRRDLTNSEVIRMLLLASPER